MEDDMTEENFVKESFFIPNNMAEIVRSLNGEDSSEPVNDFKHTKKGYTLLVNGPKCNKDSKFEIVDIVAPGEHQIYGGPMLSRARKLGAQGHDTAEFYFENQDKMIPKTQEDELVFPETLWLLPDRVTVHVTVLCKQMKIVLSQDELEHFKKIFPDKEIVKNEERKWFLGSRAVLEVYYRYSKLVIDTAMAGR